MAQVPATVALSEGDLQKMLVAQAHIGTVNITPQMGRYIWKRRNDGVHLINLGKTWEKIVLAARIIAAIENPADVAVCASRPYGQRAILKFRSLHWRCGPGWSLHPRYLHQSDPGEVRGAPPDHHHRPSH